jgi:ADP-ribose pyrophosphatase YjhB (NUDIX family)
MNAEQIMEQAQVFASAWSLVGGRFDGGDMLEIAAAEKAELHTAIEQLVKVGDEFSRLYENAIKREYVLQQERDALQQKYNDLAEVADMMIQGAANMLDIARDADRLAAECKVLRDALETIINIKFSNWSDGAMRATAREALGVSL